MVEFKACEVNKKWEFIFINDHFFGKHNAEIEHSGQTLFKGSVQIDEV